MRILRSLLALSALVFVLLAFSLDYAVRTPTAASSSSIGTFTTGSQGNDTYSLYCGLWRVDSGFISTIHIKNVLTVGPLTVTPVLFMADGTEYDLPAVWLPTAGTSNIRVNDALNAASPFIAAHRSDYGSVALRYHTGIPDTWSRRLTSAIFARALLSAFLSAWLTSADRAPKPSRVSGGGTLPTFMVLWHWRT